MLEFNWALMCMCGCTSEAVDPGLNAYFRIQDAEFIEGALPQPTDGPEVLSVSSVRVQVRANTVGEPLVGVLDTQARTVAIAAAGDVGYWRVTSGPPDVLAPEFPTFDVRADVTTLAPIGALDLQFQAFDEQGRSGLTKALQLEVLPMQSPEGALVVTLGWDTPSDLDLRVTAPSGQELGARQLATDGGVFVQDSNDSCVLGGGQREHVMWQMPPMPGLYIVRVDTFSLCSASLAHYWVEVRRSSEVIHRAQGISRSTDTRFNHGMGAGVTVLTFELEP